MEFDCPERYLRLNFRVTRDTTTSIHWLQDSTLTSFSKGIFKKIEQFGNAPLFSCKIKLKLSFQCFNLKKKFVHLDQGVLMH